MTMKHISKIISEYMSENGKKGWESRKKKFAPDHMQQIAKLPRKKRKFDKNTKSVPSTDC